MKKWLTLRCLLQVGLKSMMAVSPTLPSSPKRISILLWTQPHFIVVWRIIHPFGTDELPKRKGNALQSLCVEIRKGVLGYYSSAIITGKVHKVTQPWQKTNYQQIHTELTSYPTPSLLFKYLHSIVLWVLPPLLTSTMFQIKNMAFIKLMYWS